jgi:hypothetical protein
MGRVKNRPTIAIETFIPLRIDISFNVARSVEAHVANIKGYERTCC